MTAGAGLEGETRGEHSSLGEGALTLALLSHVLFHACQSTQESPTSLASVKNPLTEQFLNVGNLLEP